MVKKLTSDWFMVAEGYSFRTEFTGKEIKFVWAPHMPPKNALQRMLDSGRYRAVRTNAVKQLSSALGANILVAEI